jgi:hypothetical protein
LIVCNFKRVSAVGYVHSATDLIRWLPVASSNADRRLARVSRANVSHALMCGRPVVRKRSLEKLARGQDERTRPTLVSGLWWI